jgi:predicted dinucleotide-binding enzyme
MRIGIIGSDDRAMAVGRLLISGGHDVSFSDPRGAQPAEQAAWRSGAKQAEIPYRQACTREILIFAVPGDAVDRAVAAVGSGIQSLAIVDATDGKPAASGRSNAEALANKLDSHRVVRALITLPQAGASIPICGDDPIAKQNVEEAFAACNCVVTDRGPLSAAAELEPPRAA